MGKKKCCEKWKKKGIHCKDCPMLVPKKDRKAKKEKKDGKGKKGSGKKKKKKK